MLPNDPDSSLFEMRMISGKSMSTSGVVPLAGKPSVRFVPRSRNKSDTRDQGREGQQGGQVQSKNFQVTNVRSILQQGRWSGPPHGAESPNCDIGRWMASNRKLRQDLQFNLRLDAASFELIASKGVCVWKLQKTPR